MLTRATTTAYNPAHAGFKPILRITVRVIRTISAVTVARSAWSIKRRSRLAAAYVAGLIVIDPTVVLAARVFGVSVRSVYRSIETLNLTPVTGVERLVAAWNAATPSERTAFGEAVGPAAIWDECISPVI